MEEDCMEQVANMLRFFVRMRNYGYVDRMANALTPDPAEAALVEAYRHLRSLYDSSKEEGGLRKVEVDGKILTLPKIPDQECTKKILEIIRKNPPERKTLALMALSF
ncbi:type I-A CRISPR-associated protein Csa5 [Candidatus Methanodesulfokora washburnensis]|jgi:CRISPR type I-A-associated protein Csa5|uniref:Type I-A CRISPR-associated protein Csa5 n=1 Tax=Candidatus Methanodesulfokora washburnensis TaxID=2478471 RepID=A0A429GHC1_9CREN|nr:type I-A CRISPR-associated protein Csa5 [Candidatus Methanodesulfokores washburnensis]RSN73292.1 type I-A CRISPR-associated protein Csa5 [Candidatus Methanodesulfokores washburnensis]